MSVERRRSARVPFVASAEIIDDEENTRSSSQVSDLSLHGCCVKAPDPFPVGTSVTIEIYRDADFLEAPATVAYFTPAKGHGPGFYQHGTALCRHPEKMAGDYRGSEDPYPLAGDARLHPLPLRQPVIFFRHRSPRRREGARP
jgi:hypothetical protein